MQHPISSHAKLLTFGKACGEAWRWHIDTSWILKPIRSKAATVEFVEVLELLGLHNMERNGCGDVMETELQNMERNGRETEENRGMEGGENIECKGMKTEEYRVCLSPPLTWSLTLLDIWLFWNFLILCLLLELMFVLPYGVMYVFEALTGLGIGAFPFCVT